MKPMHFDFAAKPMFRRIWAFFAVLSMCVLITSRWEMSQLKQQSEAMTVLFREMQTRPNPLQTKSPESNASSYAPAFSRQANQAAQLLQTDSNKAFTALENLKIPGVRLKSLNLNATQNLVEVEFEFTQLSQASDISEALMAGYSKSPWQLISTTTQIRNALHSVSPSAGFTGRWHAKLDQL